MTAYRLQIRGSVVLWSVWSVKIKEAACTVQLLLKFNFIFVSLAVDLCQVEVGERPLICIDKTSLRRRRRRQPQRTCRNQNTRLSVCF